MAGVTAMSARAHAFSGAQVMEKKTVQSEAQLLHIKESLQEIDIDHDIVRDANCIVDSLCFKTFMIVMTCLNTVQMGIEVDYPEWETTWTVAENTFTAVFAGEMVLKLIVFRMHYFTDKANWLDGGLAMLGVVDCWFLSWILGGSGDLSTVSTLRVLRFARIARIFRLVHRVKPLVLVLQGILQALSTTVYVLLVCIFIFYVFALVLTKHLGKSDMELYPGYTTDKEIIDENEFMQNYNPYVYFGSMLSSMVTLFNMATFAEWPEIVRPILIKQPWYLPVFVFFATLCSFGLMNVLIGIIADAVLTESKKVEADYQESIKHQKLKVLDKIQAMLHHIDADKDGMVDLEELSTALQANKELKKMMGDLHLPRGWSATELLDMLDHSGDGVLAHAEFTTSLFRLLDSNEFQQACIIQSGINHVKALIMDQNKHFGAAFSSLKKDMAVIKASLGVASKRTSEEEKHLKRAKTARELLGQSSSKHILEHEHCLDEQEQSDLISRLELVVRECIHEEFNAQPGEKSELRSMTSNSKAFSSEKYGTKVAVNNGLHATNSSSLPMERPVDFESVVLDFSPTQGACATCSQELPSEDDAVRSNIPSLQHNPVLTNRSAGYAKPVPSSKVCLDALPAKSQLGHSGVVLEAQSHGRLQL